MSQVKSSFVSYNGYKPAIIVSRQLTHLPMDKMAAILANDIFKCIYLNEYDRNPIQISLKIFPGGPIDNNPALVIRTLHDCPSQMNENLMISNSKLTSDSELIW